MSEALRGTLLGFAAGVMLAASAFSLIVSETHRGGHQMPATLGVMGSFAVMMVLDNAFA